MEFLATITHANNKFNFIFDAKAKIKITTTTGIILKRVWESKCDIVFNNIQFDITKFIMLCRK